MARKKQAIKRNEPFDLIYVIVNKADPQMIWACEGEPPTDLMDDEICFVYRYTGTHEPTEKDDD